MHLVYNNNITSISGVFVNSRNTSLNKKEHKLHIENV